jgi:signal transduction histidine kinase
MPQKPDDLSRIIREMAKRATDYKGLSLDVKALERIGRIPIEYRERQTIDVDLAKLEEMIRDIIELAAKYASDRIIEVRAMERALSEVRCHYLWFC